jgi:hypothetical protein
VRQASIRLPNVMLCPLQKARNSLARRGCVGEAHRRLDGHPCGFVRYSRCGGERLSTDTPGACTPRLAVRKPLPLPGVALHAGQDARSRYGSCCSTLYTLYPLDRRARSALALQEVARVGRTAQTLRQPQYEISVRSPVDVIARLMRSSGQSASRTVIGYQVGNGTARHTREHRSVMLRPK